MRDIAVSLARQPDVVEFARSLVRHVPAADRLARLTAAFTFVSHLVDVPPPEDGQPRDGVDVLCALAGESEGPATVLAALLHALGERASIETTPEMAFVRVELELDDIGRLPPHARLLSAGGRYYLPLDARDSRRPLGFLPRRDRALPA